MAQRYGFFNAVVTGGNADRSYSADDFNDIFKGILSDGVISGYDNALLVEAGGGMTVTVNTGKAYVNSHWYVNDAVLSVPINSAHATLNRYTGIAVRCNRTNRTIEIVTSDGTPAVSPVAPDLVQTDDIYDIALALIYISAGSTSITAGNITDSRTYVSGMVDPTPFNYRRYEFTNTAYENGQRYFDIPMSYGLTLNTKLQVFTDGVLESESAYSLMVNEVEGNYMVVFPEGQPKPLNTVMGFVMIN